MPPRMREPLPKRERERSPIREREARDPRRSPAPVKRDADSPPRRRQRIIPRYTCYVPRAIASEYVVALWQLSVAQHTNAFQQSLVY